MADKSDPKDPQHPVNPGLPNQQAAAVPGTPGKSGQSHFQGYHKQNKPAPGEVNTNSGGNTPPAARQNFAAGGKNYYNNKRAGYPNKINNSQFGYYQPNMYPGYYYPYYQGMVGMGGMPYSPQGQAPMQAPVQQYSGKVKVTDREGKQVDLDEKLAASTPAAAHVPLASAESTPSPTPAAPAAPGPGKLATMEEFRRKILEKAQLAKEKKEKEAAARAQGETGKPAPQPVKIEAPPAKTEAEPVKTEAKAEPVKTVPQPEPAVQTPVETKEVEPPVAPEPAESTPSAPSAESAESAPSESVSAPVTESKPEPAPVTESTSESTEVAQQQETEVTEGEPASNENEKDDDIEKDEEDEDEEAEEGSLFDLSLFFTRLNEATPIDDPFSFNYPYPLTGVDARWKEGNKKYRYDPQFLLQFRDFVQYPIDDAWKEKLESLGIVPNKRLSSGGPRMNSNKFGGQMSGRFNGSMSGRSGQYDGRQNSRSGSKRRGGSSMGGRDKSLRNRNQSKRGKERDDEPPKPAEDVKPLVPSANRWVPRSRAKPEEVKTAPDGTILLNTEDIERKVKSALNKLTLEMFEPITEDLLTIAKQSRWEDDAKTIKQVISLTFAKACDEPYWSSVYAQFCAKMLKEIPEEIKDVNTLTKSGEPATGGDLARRLLLATCQVEYEKGWVDKLPTNEDGSPLEPEMMSDEYYAMAAAKRRGLGLVKFIGNLYILNMLNDQVILHCLRDQSKNVIDPSEDSLENLAQLIKTVGPRFETSERNRAALNMIYDNIEQILDKCQLSSRIKFMLMDLQDLRKSNWKAIKQESGPKTIKEIHNEAELKRIEDSRAQAEKRRHNKSGYNSGNYGGNDSRSNSMRGGSSWGNKKDSRGPTKDSRGFTAVPRSQSNRPPLDPSMSTSTISPRENSKRTDSMASNMFAALDGDDDESESTGL